ncbi:MAG: VCBS repeat-containing protein [Desulfuromonadaceae bacterium]|nr:VCBS repeat-containing protein [Desulfuromonadaceae bacterium]MDD2849020.1 VCBS repeat-containing protein [Desulfuromonadaceae bacterium]MDD4131823.1 VCBS repeat-containing protein [Desulfuromonadaceae bacterium]
MRGVTLQTACFALVIFLLIPVLNASAALVNGALARDFAPASGYIVETAGNQFIIDLDAKQQIAVGDIFSVVTPGAKIVHPVTKAVLGSLDTVKGFLQITGIKSGYSYCRQISSATALQKGDAIRRFQNVDAEFWDYTGQGEAYFTELQSLLPHLQWQGYASSQKGRPTTPTLPKGKSAALYFILTSQGLEVRSPDFELIHSYPAVAQSAMSAVTLAAVEESAVIKSVVPSGIGNYWTSPPLKGTPIGLEVGDFDGDGRQELAVAFEDRLEISRLVNGSYQQLGTVHFGNALRGHHLDGFDLKKNGRMQLFVSAITDSGNLSGLIIESQDGTYRVTRNKIAWHLRRITLPGDGAVLIAQKMGFQGRKFAGPLFRVKLVGTELVEGEPITVPPKVNLYDFAALPGKQHLFASLGEDGYLNIVTAEGQVLGSSVDKMGGNESCIEMRGDVQIGGESWLSYLPARVEVNAAGEIIVPVNSGFSVLSRAKMYSRSELKAMVWDGATLRDVWHSTPEKSYLADFRLADANNDGQTLLVTAVAYPDNNPFSPRRSALHVYRLP